MQGGSDVQHQHQHRHQRHWVQVQVRVQVQVLVWLWMIATPLQALAQAGPQPQPQPQPQQSQAVQPQSDSAASSPPQAVRRLSPDVPAAAAPAATSPAALLPVGRPRVALVLSGGGARGFAHIGVLKVLRELNVPVDLVTGTSMGAIVGGAFAAGYSARDLEALVGETDWQSIFSKRAPREGLFWRRKEDDFKNLSDFEFGIKEGGFTLPRGLAGTQRLELFLRAIGGPVKEVRDLGSLPLPFTALATDLSTGRAVELQSDISLSSALRASMAVPGVFTPVEYRDQILVDGGIIDNLPVAAARRRGAQIVIAVNVGTPLLPREKLRDVVSVAEQLALILGIESVERAIATLGENDILITPQFGALNAGDFDQGIAQIAAGEAAARALADRLRALAVAPATYADWDDARTRPVTGSAPAVVAAVTVSGLKTVNPKAVLAGIDVPRDRPTTTRDIEHIAQQVYGSGDFEAVSYSLIGPADAPTLAITPFEKSWGYNTVRLGGQLQTDFRDGGSFTGIVAHTWRWLNDWGAEWRNELSLGRRSGFLTEWYQPLGAGSDWFVLPRLSFERTQRNVFAAGNDTPVEVTTVGTYEAALGVGYSIGRVGFASVSRVRTRFNNSALVSATPVAEQQVFVNRWQLRAVFDTLDSVTFPRYGRRVQLGFSDYGRAVSSVQRSQSVELNWIEAHSSGRLTWVANAQAGRAVQPGSFQLGGLFKLSGSLLGSVSGSRLLFGSLVGYRNVSDALGDLRVPVYLGASLEVGNAVEAGGAFDRASLRRAASLFVAGDTLLGPVYLAYGSTNGGRSALYLFWGQFR